MNKHRIEALSDGIFAVAMTLLVFGFKADAIGPGLHLDWHRFRPQLLSYILSFLIVGVYWVAHHIEFHFVQKANRSFLWCNNLFLMSVAFLPFPASLLGENPGSRPVILLYGCTLIVANATLTITWYCAWRTGLLHPNLPERFPMFVTLLTSAPALVYAVAVLISFFNRTIPPVLFAAVPAFFIVPTKFLERRVSGALAQITGSAEPS